MDCSTCDGKVEYPFNVTGSIRAQVVRCQNCYANWHNAIPALSAHSNTIRIPVIPAAELDVMLMDNFKGINSLAFLPMLDDRYTQALVY